MNQPLIVNFKAAYRDMMCLDLAKLDELYSHDVIFRDPVHRVNGLAAVQDYFAAMVADVEECRFDFLDELVANESAYFKWDMYLKHPRLARGELLTVRGISQIQFNERIYYQEDSYDLGQMLYEQVPLIGSVTRWLKLRMVS